MKLLPQAPHEYEFQMVSFVDVIFVLLSFFVLGSTFKTGEKDFALGYNRPALASGAYPGDFPENVVIELRRVDQAVAIRVGVTRLEANDFKAITAKLAEVNLPDRNVILATDGSLSIEALASAMDAVLASPMKKVSVAVLKAPGVMPAPPGSPPATPPLPPLDAAKAAAAR